MDNNRHWVGTWTTSPAPSETGVGFNNHTVRMHPRVSIGGDTLRVRVVERLWRQARGRRRFHWDPGQGPGDRAGLAHAHLAALVRRRSRRARS